MSNQYSTAPIVCCFALCTFWRCRPGTYTSVGYELIHTSSRWPYGIEARAEGGSGCDRPTPSLSSAMIRTAHPLRVYVVEDSDIILRLLTSAIESAGGELVGAADNAQQAIHQLQELKPHLILIDLVLTSGSGFEVLDALQTGAARGAVGVVFTNHATTEERERSLLLGASYFFDKSTQGGQALQLINMMAAERRGRTSRRTDPESSNGQG
jgi:two-component system response regulator DevR